MLLKTVVLFLFSFVVSCATSHVKNPKQVLEAPTLPEELVFRIATGSCNNQDQPQDFWNEISNRNPQLWLWLGDSVSGEFKTIRELEKKYKKLLGNPHYKAFISQLHVTGTWDDRDFGAKDAGTNFPLKEKSKDLFWDFMQIPRGHVLRYQNGVYRSEEWSLGSFRFSLQS